MNSKKDIHSKEVDLHFINIDSFDKPLWVTAYLLRFIANLKNGLSKERINLGNEMTIEEELFAERLLIV